MYSVLAQWVQQDTVLTCPTAIIYKFYLPECRSLQREYSPGPRNCRVLTWPKFQLSSAITVRPGLCLYPGQQFLILMSIWPSERPITETSINKKDGLIETQTGSKSQYALASAFALLFRSIVSKMLYGICPMRTVYKHYIKYTVIKMRFLFLHTNLINVCSYLQFAWS